MAWSDSILAEKNICDEQLSKSIQRVRELEMELEELEYALKIGDQYKSNHQADIAYRKSRLEDFENLKKSTLAGKRYLPGMYDDLNINMPTITKEVEAARETLETGRKNCSDELEREIQNRDNLRMNISTLEERYRNALNQEAWDREQERLAELAKQGK